MNKNMNCKRCHEIYNERIQKYNREVKVNSSLKEVRLAILHGSHQVHDGSTTIYLCKKHYEEYMKAKQQKPKTHTVHKRRPATASIKVRDGAVVKK